MRSSYDYSDAAGMLQPVPFESTGVDDAAPETFVGGELSTIRLVMTGLSLGVSCGFCRWRN